MARSRKEAPPFDQGLFLLHLNKGREQLRTGNLISARSELQIAETIRNDDEDVLNLLSVVYFKSGDLEEAEKITRRLLSENDDSAVLHSNLGVILVKNGNFDEAESQLRRAIELKPDHQKSHLYLGYVYRQKRKLGLALEHFRFAGADKLVAELQAELRRSTRETGELRSAPGRGEAGSMSTTNRLVIPKEFRASAPSRRESRPDPVADKLFRILNNGTVEIKFQGEVLVRRGTVASYSGKITFAADPKLAGTKAESLLKATGKGSIFLADRGRRPVLIDLENEFFSAEASRVLAIGPTLSFRYEPIHDFPRRRRVDVLRVYGRGGIVLSPSRENFSIAVSPDLPLNVSSRDLIGWTGNLVPSVPPDRFLDEVMLPDTEDPPKIRFEGEGSVMAEAPA
jgi:Tfp pilus assembly protein PilF